MIVASDTRPRADRRRGRVVSSLQQARRLSAPAVPTLTTLAVGVRSALTFAPRRLDVPGIVPPSGVVRALERR